MKSPTPIKILCVFILLLVSRTSLQAQMLDQQVDDLLKEAYPSDGPGVSFLIAKDGKPIYQKAFGMADLELNIPMTPQNVFEIGSITKQFTAVAILMLEEQGKLKIEDDITTYIPDYPTKGRKITIEQLLNHTSGIKSYTGMVNFMTNSKIDFSPTELIDVFKNEPMDFEPGEQFRYNNSGYILLGYIIEATSGQTYEDFIEKNIFETIGMTNSRYGHKLALIQNRASGYSENENNYRNANYLSMTLPYAAGSLMSTTEDLLTWQSALNNYKLITKASYEKAIHGSTLNNGDRINYGYGLEETNVNGSTSIQHGGGIFGYSTMGIYLPEEDVYVSGLTNCDCKDISGLTAKIAAMAIGKPFPDKKDAITLSQKDLEKWVGAYEYEGNIIRHISLEKGQLYSQREGSTKMEIYPLTNTKFIFENGNTAYLFSEKDGTRAVEMSINGETTLGKEINKTPPAEKIAITIAPKNLKKYSGTYEMAPGVVMEVTTKDSQIFAQLSGQPKFEMFPEREDVFFLKVVVAQITFHKDDAGIITSLTLNQNGRQIPAKKIE